MNALLISQAAAQFGSLFVYIMMTRWRVAPWLRTLSRANALIALLWIHVFRYVALQAYSAQHSGFPISDQGLRDVVLGDVGGAILAFAAIALLQMRSRLGLFVAAVLVAETAYDTVTNIHGGMQEHLLGAASGLSWFILAFYVPAVVVSAVLIAWQLLSRRREPLVAEMGVEHA
jgi:hypothetical protein